MTGDNPLDLFRALVLDDLRHQARLAAIVDPDSFTAAAREIAAGHDLDLSEGDLAPVLRPDPLGIARLEPVPPSPGWAPIGWLPVDIIQTDWGPAIDWAHFGGDALTDPFFAASIRRVISRPFNRVLRWQTLLDDFIRSAEPVPPPRGLVFHWSRCGSTLVSQMLAALPGASSISEAAPIDGAVRFGDPDLLRAVAAALARGASSSFLKLNCWHGIAIPLFRRAFPETPWIFLHREPLDILASHARMSAPEMSPQVLSPQVFGIGADLPPSPEYEARVLARIAEAATAAAETGSGLFLDYPALPGAVCAAILPHFGLRCGPAEKAELEKASRADAKQPGRSFSGSGGRNREAPPPETLDAAEQYLTGPRRRLLALSFAGSGDAIAAS